jgi:peroxiredoxin
MTGAKTVGRRAAVSALAAAAALGLAACEAPPVAVAPGDAAPAFELPRLEGGTAAFPGDYRGRVVALRFWADWCPFCRSEIQALEPLYERHRGRGLVLLAVNVMQPRERVEAFVRDLGSSAEVLLDGDGSVTRAYAVLGLPVTVFVDRQGIVSARVVGESTPEAFERVAQPLLEAKPPAASVPAP